MSKNRISVAIVTAAMFLASCHNNTTPTSTGPDPKTLPLVIKKAEYGHWPDGPTADVTQKVIALQTGGTLSFKAGNIILGDAAPGLSKKLRLEFMSYGMTRVRWIDEDQQFDVSISGPPRLVIKKAVYGSLTDNKVFDVTTKVVEEADNDSLKIDATNAKFGDPAPGGWGKKFKVDYTYDGKDKSRTVAENETMTITIDDKSPPDSGAQANKP